MMIAIVILGLGLVMTATMFPVAWTRARTLTEYTTQRVVSQSAAATIAETIRPSGSTFTAYVAGGRQTGKYFISSGGLAGDLFFDPVLYADADPGLRLPCNGPAQCYSHLAVLIPSDIRVHALNMENMPIAGTPTSPLPGENPYLIEKMIELCRGTPKVCRTDYPIGDPPMSCDSPLDGGAGFCARSFYSPQVGLGARMYPPMDNPPADPAAYSAWLDRFNTHRYTWSALHRLRSPVGPAFVPAPPDPLPVAESTRLASQAAQAVGTTRTFDFYIVTLKRPQSTSRFAVQNPDPSLLPDWTVSTPANIAALSADKDVALPVAWRVQLEIPANLKSAVGLTATPTFPDDDPTGIPTEVQVPPTALSDPSSSLVVGMFPVGTQFVDEINGQIYRVVSRRLSATGDKAFLTLDRELLLQDFDNSPEFGSNGALDPQDLRRTVWVYPPPIAERQGSGTGATVVFDDKSPVVGIDVRTISMTPPG